VKRSLRAAGAKPEQAAEQLAEIKALKVSQRHPGALAIGADQLLVCDGTWFDKPLGRAAALAQLEALQGRTHRLVTSLVVARDGQRLWHHQEAPRITLRRLDRAQLERYLEAAGEGVLASVGAYHLEGLGAQLMLKVEGDHFTVQGLPLLPLLEFLRLNKALA
jgi:septum formation protein